MTDYGIKDDGSFDRKHVDDIVDSIERSLRNSLGDDIELRQSSPLKQIVDTVSVELGLQWQALEDVYFDTFFEDASGEALDKQLALAGFSRLPQRSATGIVEFSVTDPAAEDVTIPEGTVVTTEAAGDTPAIPFATTTDTILQAGDTAATVGVEALKPWETDVEEEYLGEATNVAANTITKFDTPVAGVDSVTNPRQTGDPDEGDVVGRDRETDPEFKLRYRNEIAASGNATLRAIEAAVFNADDRIESVNVDERRDAGTDEYGVEVTVLAPGVPDDDIAEALVVSRAAGLDTFGSETGSFDGRSERFDRATEATIYVDATLTTADTFPSDGVQSIKDRLIRFIGGEASDGVQYPGLGIGEDVVFDQVKRRVLQEEGVVEADVAIDTSSSPTATSNIVVGDTEAAMTGSAEVTVSEQ